MTVRVDGRRKANITESYKFNQRAKNNKSTKNKEERGSGVVHVSQLLTYQSRVNREYLQLIYQESHGKSYLVN